MRLIPYTFSECHAHESMYVAFDTTYLFKNYNELESAKFAFETDPIYLFGII